MALGTITAVLVGGMVARWLVKTFAAKKELPPSPPSQDLPITQDESAIAGQVHVAVMHKMHTRTTFSTLDVVHAVVTDAGANRAAKVSAVSLAVEKLHTSGFFTRNGYARAGRFFYPARSAAVGTSAVAGTAAGNQSAPSAGTMRVASTPTSPPAPSHASAYVATGILGLSADEMRKRALKINLWSADAAIGRRMDIIPPQTDERTALIDRGLILRGLLTEAQILEMHRVGDLWLRYRDATRYVEAAARGTADAMIAGVKQAAIEAKAERKRLTAEKRIARTAAIAERRLSDIIFLGRGVSAKLGDRRSNIEALAKNNLPLLSTPADLANKLGLSIPDLRWLAFHSEATTRPHYVYFEIPKRSGGTRLLAAPHAMLGKAQRWVLQNILQPLELTDSAHGFVPGRSTVTNARAHIGQQIVVNLDLKDFFPTIAFWRVRGLFQSIGYSPAVATVLALLCTESPRTKVLHDGTPYWVAAGDRCLPQGACTSPALSNLIVRKLDRRIAGMSKALGWTYTRYADDLTLSTANGTANMGKVFASVRSITKAEGFTINEKKGRVQRAGGRQEVTGIVVNQQLGLHRGEVRQLRAILHAAKSTGLAAQNRANHPHFRAYLEGKIGYLMMVDKAKGETLRAALAKVSK